MTGLERVVIVGGGQAGARAAQAMRAGGYTGSIAIVAEEGHPPYQRPPLSKAVLTAAGGFDQVRIHAEDYCVTAGIDVLLGSPARAIDRARCEVHVADGRILPYDRLLLATGARPRRIALPGDDLDGVLYLRSYDDAQVLRRRLVPEARVVIIGGGFIGLEVAASARALGCAVTVLEAGDRLMGRALAPAVGDWFAGLHRERGVDVRLATTPVGFSGADKVGAVVLPGGERIPADLVVVGIGIVPNVELASDAGLETANGIVVDVHCRTSDERIFAAGDVTSQRHPALAGRIRLESYQNAQGQGLAAGRNVIGIDTPYVDRLWVWSDQHGVNLQMLGMPGAGDRLVYRGDPASGAFTVFYMRGRRIAAVNAINTGRDLRQIEGLMGAGVDVDPWQLEDAAVRYRDLMPPAPGAAA